MKPHQLSSIPGITPHLLSEALAVPGCAEHRELGGRLLDYYVRRKWTPSDTGDPYPFPHSSAHLCYLCGVDGQDMASLGQHQISMSLEIAYLCTATLRWAFVGFPVFDLAYDFFHAVALTEFSRADMLEEQLVFPYHDMVVRFPDSSLLNGVRSVFMYPLFAFVEDAVEENERIRAVMRIGQITRCSLAVDARGDRLITQWGTGSTVREFIESQATDKLFNGQLLENPAQVVKMRADLELVRRILANISLYITSSGGVPPEGKKLLGPSVPIEREHPTRPRFRVGRPIHLPRVMREAAQHRSGTAWKLTARFQVAGHWRMQAYGPQRSLRRRQWIQPFWKGPATLAEALERYYEVSTPSAPKLEEDGKET